MKSAYKGSAPIPISKNEPNRIKNLCEHMILDTPADQRYDDITKLAQMICGTPITLVSLVDADRQWFKSKQGIEITETPRNVAFCAHAIMADDALVVEDATKDERFFDNPLVTGAPHVRAYLGQPLISSKGFRLGTLSAIDTKPRHFTADQIHAMKLLSRQVITLIELGNSSEKLKIAFDAMSEGVIVKRVNGQIVDFNQSVLTILDITAGQLRSEQPYDDGWRLEHEDGTPFGNSEHPSHVAIIERRECRDVVMGLNRKDKPKIWIQVNAIPKFEIGTGEVEFVVSTFRDITEEKVQAESIVHRARMAAVGEMSAGVAHEINNPLAVITGHCSIIEAHISRDEVDLTDLNERLEKIKKAAMRAAKIVSGLLSFSRDSRSDVMQPVSLKRLVDDSLLFSVERFKQNDISLEVNQVPDIQVRGNSNELSQVVINLINNAHDAVRNEKVKKVTIDFELRLQPGQSGGGVVAISVTDSGPGVPSEIRSKIMQPFFTTKEIGKGTGLGLSISRGIAERHGGRLYLDSNSIRGARFVLEVPFGVAAQKPRTQAA
jgi:signal transduction histidine kinase